VPPALAALLARPAHAEPLAADYPAFRARLLASLAGPATGFGSPTATDV